MNKQMNKLNSSHSQGHSDFIPPQHQYIQHQPFSSAFFLDHCEEQYQIQRAFKAQNFTSLRTKIPNQLKHGVILEQRFQKVLKNTKQQQNNRNKTTLQKEEEKQSRVARKKMQQVGQLGYFEVFPYQESSYTIQHDLKVRQMIESKRKQAQISSLDFRPSGFDKKMKYENPFSYIDRLQSTNNFKEDYIYPFHIPEDTYDRFHESELRKRLNQQANKIAGDFLPANNQKSLAKINRSKTAEILREIEVYLKKFLPQTGFFIGMNKRDHIDILFEAKQQENTRLSMVMSRFCEHQLLSRFIMRRNIYKWGKIGQSGYLQYSALPPWVKDIEQKLTKQ